MRLTSESWKGGLLTATAASAKVVSVSRGVMLAGGTGLTLLRAGETTIKTREAPGSIGPVRAVAVEPRRRPRLAVCGAAGIALLDGTGIGTLTNRALSPPEAIAWGNGPGGSWLYLLHQDRQLVRMRPETGDVEEIPIESAVALASDESGTIAVASINPDRPSVWVTHDGADWHWRAMPELDDVCHLAVAGYAAAVALMFEGVWVSRDRDHGFSRCMPLGEGGPLAFEGSTSDAAVFAAVHVGIAETIVSLDAGGVAATVGRIETEDEAPRLSALAWDGARRTLWAGLPGAGLIRLDAPTVSGASRPMLS